MKIFTNKKGDADTYIFTSSIMYYIIALIIIGFSIIFFVGKGSSFFISQASVSPYLEEDLLIARLVNVCFSYEVEGRIYQNVLDFNKFSEQLLRECFPEGMYITITSKDDSFETTTIRSATSTPDELFNRFILVAKDDSLYPAILTVRI